MIPTSWLTRILGGALALAALLWLIQSRDHWRGEAHANESLFHAEQAAHAATVASYRAAADQARRDDAANLARVTSQQARITERTAYDYESRIAAARALADRLRGEARSPPTDPGSGGATPVPGLPAAAKSTAQGAGEDRLSESDALTATEQAIQLDELIKWVKAQAAIPLSSSQ